MRYGFILADTYTGSSVDIEPLAVSLFPENGKDVLFFFGGGRLSKKTGAGMLRNSVYEFVRKENIDASVVWMSSLTGDLKAEEAANRLSHLNEIPFVTIAGKTEIDPGHPDITFDAYSGMKALVSHCIEKHGARRIAFIRGPENHVSSNERYNGYLDSLKENNIDIDEKLISSPVDWSQSEKAVEELIVERKLVPVKDFDLLVCASDYMLYNALKKIGTLCMDQDVMGLHFCGFNDSSDAKRLSVPCSTVALPFEEMVCRAFSTLKDLVDNKPVEKDIRLKTVPVYRKSCGCLGIHTEKTFDSIDQFIKFASDSCNCSYDDLKKAFCEAYETATDTSVRILTGLMCRFSKDFYYTNELTEMIADLPFLDEKSRNRLYSAIRYALPEEMGRLFQKREIMEQELQAKVDRFKSRLLEANTLKEVAQTLKESTADIGISEAYLVINRHDNQVLITDSDEKEFSNELVLPQNILDTLSPGSYLISSLFTEEEIHGHLVLKTTKLMGRICEEIRSAVSSAVKSSLLFEQVNKSKQMLEKAEHDRLLFFSSINNNLRDPLSQISEIIDDSEEIGEENRIKIQKTLVQTNRVVDMALNHIGELNVNFQIVDMNEVLKNVKGFEKKTELPCLFIDPGRLEDALAGFITEKSSVTAQIKSYGLEISISDISSDDVSYQYANEIVMLHGGEIKYSDKDCTVVLPYPTLSNRKPKAFESGKIACFGTRTSIDIPPYTKTVVDSDDFILNKKLPPETKLIVWGKDFYSKEARECFKILESDENYSRLPLIVFGLEWAQSLSEAFLKVLGSDKYRVLVSNDLPVGSYSWLSDTNITTCDTESLTRCCFDLIPSMVIVSDFSGLYQFLKAVRSNQAVSSVPVIVVSDNINSDLVNRIQEIPKTVLLGKYLFDVENIQSRVASILRGAEILPVYSGNIVKRVQAFLCKNYINQISRWQIAEAVHVSEDYLTSIFKKEIGISPWDYLNRYRIEVSISILQTTGVSVAEVARLTGFQGQAYFCTVFKKLKGFSPSLLRKR